MGVPVLCHPDEVADAEGDGGLHYMDMDAIPNRFPRMVYPFLLRRWDGGPVKIAGTVAEGDEVAGFTVKHFPGHAPGLIGLWRESDRLAVVSDTIYMADSMTFKTQDVPDVPHRVWNHDHAAAIASCRKLAELEPRTIAPGHEPPLVGEPQQIRALLEQAAVRAAA
jgi:glyoxylase-like metal-dependent hydrolase (beta-lactamase superfamily II)